MTDAPAPDRSPGDPPATPCPECDGTGLTGDRRCPLCDGTGEVEVRIGGS